MITSNNLIMHEDFQRFQGNGLPDLNLSGQKKLKRYSGYLPSERTELILALKPLHCFNKSSAGTKTEIQVYATVVIVKSRYSGVSIADSSTQRANRFFFSFSLAKLRSSLCIVFLVFIYYKLKNPKGSTIALVAGHGPCFFQNWFFGLYVSGCGVLAFLFLFIFLLLFVIHDCINNVFLTNKVCFSWAS